MTDNKESNVTAESTRNDEMHSRCLKMSESAMGNKKIQKLIDSINNLGCKIPKDFIVCRSCDGNVSGGFVVQSDTAEYKPTIVMCENKALNTSSFESTLIHELVHAYDMCSAKLDWKNCLHHACTEVRASTLSGECSIASELLRGNINVNHGLKKCVMRRAEKSVAMNSFCKDSSMAAVEAVFEKCYNDSKPFSDE